MRVQAVTGSFITTTDAPDRACPMCASETQSSHVGAQDGFPWNRCAGCGTRFVARRPTSQELENLYGQYYNESNLQVPQFIERRLAAIIAAFRRYRRTGRLLDVGFGQGALLRAAAADGWKCAGTEVAPAAIDLARKNGWESWAGDFCELDLPAGIYDVVCMTDLLEHVEEPVVYLRQASRVLRPGGLLYITLPNGVGLSSRLLGTTWSVYSAPEHLQLVSPGSLRNVLRRVGFSRYRIRTESVNPHELRQQLFRRRRPSGSDRVRTGYALNERLESGSALRLVKRAANEVLNLSRLGDEIKAFAEKS